MKTIKPNQVRRIRGTITHEAIIAIVIATAAILGTAQTLAIISHQRRELGRREVANREAGNLLEEIASRPWDELTADNLSALTLSEECQQRLEQPNLNVLVTPEANGAGKHIRVEIDWLTTRERRSEPLRLAAWRYPREESEQ